IPPICRAWVLPGFLLLLLVGVGSFLNRAASLHGEDGVFWTDREGSVVADRIAPGGPGSRGGLRSGDILITIDGERVGSAPRVRELLWGRGGQRIPYRIERGSAEVLVPIRPALNGEENRVFYYLWLVGGIALVTGLLSIRKLPDEPASPAF